MKTIIVFACFLALAFANYDAGVVEKRVDISPESFESVLKLDDGQFAEQRGHLEGAAHGDSGDGRALNQEGSYGWTSPEGVPVLIKYIANELGFQPTGDVIPHN